MAGKLKPLDVERETRPGKYPDGDGLYLVVASATSKNWSYRYWKDGKQRWLGMGSVKEVSLKVWNGVRRGDRNLELAVENQGHFVRQFITRSSSDMDRPT
jgi:hypothetical protein